MTPRCWVPARWGGPRGTQVGGGGASGTECEASASPPPPHPERSWMRWDFMVS